MRRKGKQDRKIHRNIHVERWMTTDKLIKRKRKSRETKRKERRKSIYIEKRVTVERKG